MKNVENIAGEGNLKKRNYENRKWMVACDRIKDRWLNVTIFSEQNDGDTGYAHDETVGYGGRFASRLDLHRWAEDGGDCGLY